MVENKTEKEAAVKGLSVHALTSKFAFENIDQAKYVPRLIDLAISGSRFEGFLNAEVMPPLSDSAWRVVQRFRTAAHTDAWRDSPVRKKIIAELEALVPEFSAKLAEEVSEAPSGSGVAMCISTEIHPGIDQQFFDWLSRIHAAQATFPGYEGTYLQAPTSATGRIWTTLLRFNGPDSLDGWFNSDVRKSLVEQGKPLIAAESIKRMTSSFPGWFPNSTETGEQPPSWKGSMLVLMALFPIVMLQGKYIRPLMGDMKLSLIIFLLNAMSIALLSFLCMPLITKRFANWLSPPKEDRAKHVWTGTAAILSIYLIENIIFWYL